MEKLTLQNKNSELILNLKHGGQIEKLLLKHPTLNKTISVIKPFDEKGFFFLSGNFLMYPWVNRLKDTTITIAKKQIQINPIKQDTNNYSIHGLYFNKSRYTTELKQNSASTKPIETNESFPEFTETYSLEENSLTLRTSFYNPTSDIHEFAYGYHPYLRLERDLEDCKIHTNLSDYIPLTKELIPNPNLEKKSISKVFSKENPIGNLELDHLFTGTEKELYFGISDIKENLLLQIRVTANSQIPLLYFQVYIPEDRKSIAIEPMTSTGNAFFIKNSGLCQLAPGETKFGEFIIELVGM